MFNDTGSERFGFSDLSIIKPVPLKSKTTFYCPDSQTVNYNVRTPASKADSIFSPLCVDPGDGFTRFFHYNPT